MRQKAKDNEPPAHSATSPIDYGLSIEAGDLIYLDGKPYVTHSGLLRVARRNRCSGIHTELVADQSDATRNRWVIKAIVFKTARSKGFEGYGDADPSNVSSLVRGAELRVAETRAVNRALRKAYGIGMCSVEEIGSFDRRQGTPEQDQADGENGSDIRKRPQSLSLRDHLALIIRRHHLDADQVKRYALSFCGVSELRQASREQIAAFIEHLRVRAEHDYSALLAELAIPLAKRPSSAAPPEDREGVA